MKLSSKIEISFFAQNLETTLIMVSFMRIGESFLNFGQKTKFRFLRLHVLF